MRTDKLKMQSQETSHSGGTMSKSGVEKLYPNNAGSGKNGYITNAGSRSYLLPMLRGGLGFFFSESPAGASILLVNVKEVKFVLDEIIKRI